jgi:hypothetical protein
MKYLLMICNEEKAWDALPAAEQERVINEHLAFADDLRRRGHYLAGEALQPIATATTVRVQRGKLVTTDGPFAETKEQLGGFYLVEARDLNEAIQLAGRVPMPGFGCVEVRPVLDFEAIGPGGAA